ncbi:hypothetical protein [Luteimonas saliphila]|uniref:hypothetical protein n=1 Tax=Luteimonas saliphila TaxID=2804919 RepID=UPI00192DA02D|nr:hypothetical protein [Luteimonas saliphila]
MTTTRRALLPLVLACALPLPSAAQATHPCASQANPANRLACYDKAFPPAPGVREAAARQAVQDFGLEKEASPLRNAGQPVEEIDPDRIEGQVAKVVYHGGKRDIALANGQVWATIEATSTGHLREGDAVTLRKGMMGNFLLTTPAGATLRVRRVR